MQTTNKNIKQKIEEIEKKIKVIAIINQIKHATNGILFDENKQIIQAVMNGKTAEIEIKIENTTIAKYTFHK